MIYSLTLGNSVTNIRLLAKSIKGLSAEEAVAKLMTKGVEEAEIKATLARVGYTESTINEVVAEKKANAEKDKTIAKNNGLISSFKGLASSLGISTLSLGAITAGLVAVGAGIAVYRNYKQSLDDAVESANNASSVYAQNTSTLNDQIETYKQLREKLVAAKGNEEETYAIKQQLFELQKSLNETYGDEVGKIDLVTDAYKDQTNALKDLNKESAQKYLNENRKGIEESTKRMTESKTYNLGTMNGLVGADELTYLEQIKEIASKYNIDFTKKGFEFTGNAMEAEKSINSFMNDLTELQKSSGETSDVLAGIFDGLLDNSGDALNKSQDIISENEDNYKQALKAEIASDDDLSKSYNQITNAVDEYNDAIAKSNDIYNDDSVKSAYDNLQSIKQGIADNEDEWGKYKSVVEDAFAQANTTSYDFYDAIQTNKDGIGDLTTELKGMSDVDLQSALDIGDADNSFVQLCKDAEQFGMSSDDVIATLNNLGITVTQTSSDVSDSTVEIQDFIDVWNSADFDSTRDKLLKLAKSGELSAQTLSSTEDYQNLLDSTGLTAEQAKTKILDMLSTSEKLSAATGTVSSLAKAFQEVKEKGYATATTIASLPDILKTDTSDFDYFSQIIGDANSTEAQVKAVFNQIVKDYLISQQTLKGVNDENKQQYINNLKEMQIENAESLVQSYQDNSSMLNAMETDYQNYIAGKEYADSGYKNIAIGDSAALKKALGSTYEDDYNNWCELLAAKGKAFNSFVNAINQATTSAWANLMGGYGELDQDKVNNGSLTMTDLMGANYDTEAAKQVLNAQAAYNKQQKALESLKETLKFDLSTVNWNGGDFSLGGTNGKTDKSKKTTSPKGSSTDEYKAEFDKKLATLKHNLAMEKITEEDYYNQLDKLNDEYFKGKKKYLDNYRKYEEEVYSGQKQIHIQNYENEASKLKQQLDLKKISEKDYYKELSSLNNKYYKDQDKYADEYKKNRQEIEQGKQTIHIAAFDDKKADLQHQLDMEEISQETYYKKLSALNKKYFANQEEYAEQYKANQEEIEKGLIEVHKTQLSTYIKLQQSKLDAGQISFQQYTSKVGTYLKKMYDSGKISAETYFSTVKDNLQYQLDIYDKVLSAVNKVYDNEIDKIQGEIDAIEKKNEALNNQKDTYDSILSAVAKVYDDAIAAANDEKQSIQDVLDTLSKENDERERQMALQKAQYNLNKALNQRSQQVLTKDGFVYSTDDDAIRNARESLRDAQYTNTTAVLKQQQTDIDDYIEKLNEFKEKWSEIPNAYQEAQDKANAIMYFGNNYQQKILQNNISDVTTFKDKYVGVQAQINNNQQLIDSYNEKIQYYNDLKDEWGKVTSAYEDGINKQYADQILGAGWESGVLEGRVKTLSSFATEYTRIQDEMAKATVAANNAIVESNLAAKKNEKTSYSGSKANVGVVTAGILSTAVKNAATAINLGSGKNNVLQQLASKLKGHASGVHKIDKDELAWTQELGAETILSPTSNAILTPLKSGDSVLDANMTDNLWDWAKINPAQIAFGNLPALDYSSLAQHNNTSSTVLQFNGDLSFPNITSGNDAQQLVNELLHLRVSNQQYLNRK